MDTRTEEILRVYSDEKVLRKYDRIYLMHKMEENIAIIDTLTNLACDIVDSWSQKVITDKIKQLTEINDRLEILCYYTMTCDQCGKTTKEIDVEVWKRNGWNWSEREWHLCDDCGRDSQ